MASPALTPPSWASTPWQVEVAALSSTAPGARRTRLRRLVAAVPSGGATTCFVSGIRPAAAYGAEATGVYPAPRPHSKATRRSSTPPARPWTLSHRGQSTARRPCWACRLRRSCSLGPRSMAGCRPRPKRPTAPLHRLRLLQHSRRSPLCHLAHRTRSHRHRRARTPPYRLDVAHAFRVS